ncbi:MAG: hypothetical protein ACRCVB_04615 [Cetobacterium sp.]|uniref:hypothetical protein n=1 Tax=unclassified Cetobacterium TaxID=2630983 RepID=UPI00064827B7|nr:MULTISPECIES: hypothetical protein [unclassified Cetobacterium]
MKKLVITGLMILSLGVFANEDVIIDKQVTGVNKEQLENYPKESNVQLEKKVIKIEDTNINADKFKDQKQVIQLNENNDSLNKSLTETETKTPIWKYIIGVVALVTLGIAL